MTKRRAANAAPSDDEGQPDDLNALISAYEQQMKKRSLKRKQLEPDYRNNLQAHVDSLHDKIKTTEREMLAKSSLDLPQDTSLTNKLEKFKSHYDNYLEASGDLLQALDKHCKKKGRDLELFEQDCAAIDNSCVDLFIAQWCEMKDGVDSIKTKLKILCETGIIGSSDDLKRAIALMIPAATSA